MTSAYILSHNAVCGVVRLPAAAHSRQFYLKSPQQTHSPLFGKKTNEPRKPSSTRPRPTQHSVKGITAQKSRSTDILPSFVEISVLLAADSKATIIEIRNEIHRGTGTLETGRGWAGTSLLRGKPDTWQAECPL